MSITIPPFGSHVIKLRFKPTAEGVRQGNLTFTSNTPNSPHTIPLTGIGKSTSGASGVATIYTDGGVIISPVADGAIASLDITIHL